MSGLRRRPRCSGPALSCRRGAVAQLLEYRLEYGRPEDLLCLAVDGGLSPRRVEILERLGIAVVEAQDSDLRPVNDAGTAVLETAP